MNILEVSHLQKNYGSFSLEDISFSLPAGYIMGYIGQNGAGKTTTLNAITRLIKPDDGEITVNGLSFDRDPVGYRDAIGYIGDSAYFPPELTCRDIRKILRDFYPSFDGDKYDAYARQWDLPEKARVKTYSRGMKVKLMFAAVLSRETRLMILDEATNGLDPVVRREILRLLQDYIADGTRSVLFSTHILEDLQDIADYVFFIHRGRRVLCEAKDDLLERYLLVRGGPEDLTQSLARRLIGTERSSVCFTGLLPADDAVALPAELSLEKPTIDEIVIHLIEGER